MPNPAEQLHHLRSNIALFEKPALERGEHVDEQPNAATILKMMAQRGKIGIPSGGEPLGEPLINRISSPADISHLSDMRDTLQGISDELKAYHAQLEIAKNEELPKKSFEFPNLAWESIRLGLAKEEFIHDKLNANIDEIQKKHETISLLLDLNAELSAVNEEGSELSDRARELLHQLNERGIDIEGKTVAEIKRLIGSHESNLRSKIQIAFTTEVQNLMGELESMNQILQSIIRYLDRLLSRINQNTKIG